MLMSSQQDERTKEKDGGGMLNRKLNYLKISRLWGEMDFFPQRERSQTVPFSSSGPGACCAGAVRHWGEVGSISVRTAPGC